MIDLLAKLYEAKAAARATAEAHESIDVLRERSANRRRDRRAFRTALAGAQGPAIIAEIKRASPSVGMIVPHLDPAALARTFQASGADAISVLTESDHFLGDLAYLDVVRSAATLPILRKDFLSTRYEVAQSSAYGADAILAIVAGLRDEQLADMLDEARVHALDVLVEVHTEAELQRALEAGAALLGINNRNLHTFETDLAVTEELLPLVPSDVTVISESGVKSQDDVRRLVLRGARGVLVGESLMRADDKTEAIRALKGAAVAVS
jgi:indole-3-glycerol phosphate synthase